MKLATILVAVLSVISVIAAAQTDADQTERIADLDDLQRVSGKALFRERGGNVVSVQYPETFFRGLLFDGLDGYLKRLAGFDCVLEFSFMSASSE